MPQNEQLEWTLFMVGCLNARLYFLVEDYDQLETFYEKGNKRLQLCQNTFNKKHYKNIQLMGLQHYANFLRARRQYDKALQCLEYGMELCENKKFYIDAVYYVNFQLQLSATKKDMNASKNVKIKQFTHSKPRRVLQFNILPEGKEQHEAAKKELKDKILQNVLALEKNPTLLTKPLPIIFSESSCSSSKKIKTQTGSAASSSSSVTSYSLDIKTIKPKPKFQICEDSFEILDIIDNVENKVVAKEQSNEDVKAMKRTKIKEENDQLHKTPKVVRKTTKSSKTTGSKSKPKIKRPEHIPQFHIDIDLTDSPSFSSVKSKSSSLENLVAKENLHTNELIAKTQNLFIKNSKSITENETKTSKCRRNQNLLEDDVIIVLEESPSTVKSAQKELLNKPKTRTRTAAKDKSPKGQTSHEDNLAPTSRPRRQRKLVLDNNEPNLENEPRTACSTPTVTASVTRRRQKKK